MLKRRGWDEGDYELAKSLGHPQSIGRTIPRLGFGVGEALYSRSAGDRWVATLKALADRTR
jgi:hypothetical protein